MLAAVLLMSCAAANYQWVRSGATEADLKAARANCNAEVERTFNRYEDFRPSYQTAFPRPPLERDMRAQLYRDEIFESCMKSLGYRKVRVTPQPKSAAKTP
jgi:hypothetical protein